MTVDGPVFVTERSVVRVGQVSVVVTLLVLFVVTGSVACPATVAVFVTVLCVQFWIVGALKIRVSGIVWFCAMEPVQTTLVPCTVQLALEPWVTKVSPVGMASVTVYVFAVGDGPLFVTLTV